MPAYEYKILTDGFFTDTTKLRNALNEAGKQGRRLVPGNVGHKTTTLIMEREIGE